MQENKPSKQAASATVERGLPILLSKSAHSREMRYHLSRCWRFWIPASDTYQAVGPTKFHFDHGHLPNRAPTGGKRRRHRGSRCGRCGAVWTSGRSSPALRRRSPEVMRTAAAADSQHGGQ
jgi:hypothetical protein